MSINFIQAAPLRVSVTQGHIKAIPIAIKDLDGDAVLGKEISDIVRNDLKNSGLLNPLATSTFLDKPASLTVDPKYADWRIIGAECLVVGSVTKQDGKFRAEIKFYDVTTEKLKGAVAFTHSDLRRVSHKIADYLFSKLTGEEGYFDTQIVFVAENRQGNKDVKRLALMDQDGHNLRYLTNGNSIVMTPRFAPKGRMIAYLDFGAKNNQPKVYTFNPDTKKTQLVGHFPGMTFAPRFSADAQNLVMSLEKKGNSSIYSMGLTGGSPRQLTHGNVIDTSPSYSPDGRQICFNSNRGGQPQIYVMNADGSGLKRISFGKGSYRTPVWSPRGDLIAFVKLTNNNFYVGVMKTDGSGERLITQGYLLDDPIWSANGRMIMYSRQERSSVANAQTKMTLNMIDLTGHHNREIFTPTAAFSAAWSPQLP